MFVNYLLVFLILVDGKRLHSVLRDRRYLSTTDNTTTTSSLPPLHNHEDSSESFSMANMDLRMGTIFGIFGMCMCFCCAFFIWSQYEIIEKYIAAKTSKDWEEDSDQLLEKVIDHISNGVDVAKHQEYKMVSPEKLRRAQAKAMKRILASSDHGPPISLAMSPELPHTSDDLRDDDMIKDMDQSMYDKVPPISNPVCNTPSLAETISQSVTHPLDPPQKKAQNFVVEVEDGDWVIKTLILTDSYE